MEFGSWTDRGRTGIASSSASAYNAIDGNLFRADGTYYMNFGSFWHDIYQAPMRSDATKVASSSHNLAYDPSGTHAVEGPYMYQYGSYYYLFFSAGICCGYDTSRPASGAEYKIKVCRSTSPTSGFVCYPILLLPWTARTDSFSMIGRQSRYRMYQRRWHRCFGKSWHSLWSWWTVSS
jgi:arabinan endo-1,5-alpha-L-arabinosidase